MEKKRYEGIEIKPVYLDGEEVIITSACVSSWDTTNGGPPPSMNDWVYTGDYQGMASAYGLPEGFYPVTQFMGPPPVK